MTEATAADGTATARAVRVYLDALEGRDPDTIAATVAEDFVSEHISSAGRGLQGRDAYRARLPIFLAEFEELHYEPEAIIADGERAAVPYRMSATWTGAPPARHPIVMRGVFVFRVSEGLVAQRTDYWNADDFLRQTGQR